jgi:hypothetical protein
MKVQVDESKFDALQMAFGYAITHEIYTALKKAGVSDSEQLEEIVAHALFGIGCIVDGSQMVEGPDGPMEAILTFRKTQDDNTLISGGGGSWIHEYAFGIAKDYFDQRRPKRNPLAPPPARRDRPPPGPFDGFVRMVRDVAEAFTKP